MPRPIVSPSTQLFGSGFGQNGSTSNRGACTVACVATDAIERPLATASVVSAARRPEPMSHVAARHGRPPAAAAPSPLKMNFCRRLPS